VIDEPGEHGLVAGDEAPAIEEVFGDQDEQRQVGDDERGGDGQRPA
jgi:hypothetical protein